MGNKCPKCGKDNEYTFENTVEQDGDVLWVTYWCRCKSCGQCWRYVERFTLEAAWIEAEKED